jgi:hypothetical protein
MQERQHGRQYSLEVFAGAHTEMRRAAVAIFFPYKTALDQPAIAFMFPLFAHRDSLHLITAHPGLAALASEKMCATQVMLIFSDIVIPLTIGK